MNDLHTLVALVAGAREGIGEQVAHCVGSTPIAPLHRTGVAQYHEGAARITGPVIAVDGGFTTLRPPVR